MQNAVKNGREGGNAGNVLASLGGIYASIVAPWRVGVEVCVSQKKRKFLFFHGGPKQVSIRCK